MGQGKFRGRGGGGGRAKVGRVMDVEHDPPHVASRSGISPGRAIHYRVNDSGGRVDG